MNFPALPRTPRPDPIWKSSFPKLVTSYSAYSANLCTTEVVQNQNILRNTRNRTLLATTETIGEYTEIDCNISLHCPTAVMKNT